jgi:metallo-beta-lactamase class B
MKKQYYASVAKGYKALREEPTTYYAEPFRIFGNLYFVGDRNVSCHLVDTGDGLLLFDTGYPHMSGQLLYNIFKIGFDPADIKMIFHTHGHFDHFGATKLLVRLTGAKTLLGWRDAKMFREDSEFALCDYLEGIPTEMFVPDIEVHDGDIFRIGNTVVEAYETPGHSEGAITYRIHVTDGEEEKIALLCGGAGFNTLKREFIALFCNESWRDDFEHSLKKWRELTCDIYLGNHTGQSDTLGKRARMEEGKPNPFLDPADWGRFVEDLEKHYREMIAQER